MATTRLIGQRISRHGWGMILITAAFFAIVAAALLQAMGLGHAGFGPLAFVLTIVAVKLGLFAFWPVLQRGAEASTLIQTSFTRAVFPQQRLVSQDRRRRKLQLWNEDDPRVDIASFAANVPAFVLTHEQFFLDWNPAFALIFGDLPGLQRGAHVREWYAHLDNFRRVSKRTAKLFGEAILPITDRERICFASPEFGRMVFTRIMTPIIDRESGRVIGWNVVLNINSVTKREAFFERLFAAIATETKRARFAASCDGLFQRYSPYKHLLALHARHSRNSYRILSIGAQSSNLTQLLLEDQARHITTVDSCAHMLRKMRSKCAKDSGRLRLVKRALDDLGGLPRQRFDAAIMSLSLHRVENFVALVASVYRALRPHGTFSISFVQPHAGIEGLYGAIRQRLDEEKHFDALKHQFAHTIEYERQAAVDQPYRYRSREQVLAALQHAGFTIESEYGELLDGQALMVVARKV